MAGGAILAASALVGAHAPTSLLALFTLLLPHPPPLPAAVAAAAAFIATAAANILKREVEAVNPVGMLMPRASG